MTINDLNALSRLQHNAGYSSLAAHIIFAALRDRQVALRALRKYSVQTAKHKTYRSGFVDNINKANNVLSEVDAFFLSDWFGELVSFSGIKIDAEELRAEIFREDSAVYEATAPGADTAGEAPKAQESEAITSSDEIQSCATAFNDENSNAKIPERVA